MSKLLTDYRRTVKAEWLKQRRSGLLYFCLASAAFIPLISIVTLFLTDFSKEDETVNGLNYYIVSNIKLFTVFFFPLFLIIMVTRLVYMEHRSDTWKLLQTQPVSRFFLYFSKWQMAVLLSLLCLIALFVFTCGTGLIAVAARSNKFANNHIEWNKDIQLLTRLWVDSLGLISLQYVISLWITNMAWPLIIGIISLVAGTVFNSYQVLDWFPYAAISLTTTFANGSNSGSFFLPHELLSIAWAVLFFWLGYAWFRHKKFVRAYFLPYSRLIASLLIIFIFGSSFYLLNRPALVNRYGKTVIAGNVHLKQPVETIIIYKYPAFDTLMVIPVHKGSFHFAPAKKIEKGIYKVRAGLGDQDIFFGEGDSVNITWTEEPFLQCTITGSRIAENSYLLANRYNRDVYRLQRDARYLSPASFYIQVQEAWKKNQKNLDGFVTLDHIRPAEDFIQLKRKLLALDFLRLTEVDYPDIMAVYFPNDTTKYSFEMKQLRSLVSLDDSELVNYPDYRDYVTALIEKKAFHSGGDFYSTLQKEIHSQTLRNALLYDAISKKMNALQDSAKRASALQQSLTFLNDESLQKKLIEKNEKLNKLQTGKKAPPFTAETINGNIVTLDNLKDRFLVIDLWATWCGPCKMESPYFEKLAEEYTDDNLAFASISVDDNKNDWKVAAREKSNHVLQLWACNWRKDFQKGYEVAGIPRFILIDKLGNIVDIDFPHPSDPKFEIDLQKALHPKQLTSY